MEEQFEYLLTESGVDHHIERSGVPLCTIPAVATIAKRSGGDRPVLKFRKGSNVRVGDVAINVLSGKRCLIEDVETKIILKEIFCVEAFYVDEKEAKRKADDQRQKLAAAPIFNIEKNFGIVGTQAHAHQTQTFDMRSVEAEIQRRGEDVEELKELAKRISDMIASDTLPRGGLTRYSEMFEKHSWFTGAVLSAILGHLIK